MVSIKRSSPVKSAAVWAAATMFCLSSCNATSNEALSPESSDPSSGDSSLTSKTSPNGSSDQLQIVTTFLPITHFTRAVIGIDTDSPDSLTSEGEPRAQVTQLLPPNIEPHDYQAKPQDAQRLAQADILITNGLGVESFLSALIANAKNDQLTVVDTSQGIKQEMEAVSAEEEVTHSDHSHGDADPHIWLDPKKAIQQVENIRDALILADPAGKEIYTANAANYISKLQALDQEMATALAPYANQTFVTYHDFAHHFAHSYDLEVEYLVNVPEGNAAPADVRRVIEAAQASNLKTLLSEPQQQGSPFEAIAQDLAVEVSLFDPLETSGPEGQSPDYYFTVMEQNLENLEVAFGKASP